MNYRTRDATRPCLDSVDEADRQKIESKCACSHASIAGYGGGLHMPRTFPTQLPLLVTSAHSGGIHLAAAIVAAERRLLGRGQGLGLRVEG